MNQTSKIDSIQKSITESDNENIIFQIEIQNLKNNQNWFTEHFYSLFLLLYYYGQLPHQELIISKAEQCKNFHIYYLQQFNDKEIQNNENCQYVKYIIESLTFLIDIFRIRIPQEEINEIDKVSKLWNSVSAIYELEYGYGSSCKVVSLSSLAKMIAFVLKIKCTTRNFQSFSLIQFTCSEFKSNNIEAQIEINKQKQTYHYIKKRYFKQNYDGQQSIIRIDDQLSSDSCDSLSYIKFKFMESQTESIKQAEDFYFEESFALKSLPQSPRNLYRSRSRSPSTSYNHLNKQNTIEKKAQIFNINLFKVKQSQSYKNISKIDTKLFNETNSNFSKQQTVIQQSIPKKSFISRKCSLQTQNSINNTSPSRKDQYNIQKIQQCCLQSNNKDLESQAQCINLDFSYQQTNILPAEYLKNNSQKIQQNRFNQQREYQHPKLTFLNHQTNNSKQNSQKHKIKNSQGYNYPSYIKYQSMYCSNKYRNTIS